MSEMKKCSHFFVNEWRKAPPDIPPPQPNTTFTIKVSIFQISDKITYMGYVIEINSLLVLPETFPIRDLVEGKSFDVRKDDSRLFSIGIPLEFCDCNYKYLGKVKINWITIEKEHTSLNFTVLKMFSDLESKIFSENFIKP